MGKVYNNKQCSQCNATGKVIQTWGKYYCRQCWDSKPHKPNSGHSGMIYRPVLWDIYMPRKDSTKTDIELELVPKSNILFSNLYLTHYPGSKGIIGRQFNYLIHYKEGIAGIIGANSPPLNYKRINAFFPPQYDERNWLNNNIYRLIYSEANLGSRVLRVFRKRIKNDYEAKYQTPLIGLITFVELPRTGSIYRADNWVFLGETQGKQCKRSGSHGKWINKEWSSDGNKKLIFARLL